MITVIGKYTISVVPYGTPDALYYEVLLTKLDDQFNYYVDLTKEFKTILALDDKNRTTKDSFCISSIDDTGKARNIYPEYESYLERRGMPMPTWKLSQQSVDKLITLLHNQ